MHLPKPLFRRVPTRLSPRTRKGPSASGIGAERIFGYASADAIGRSLDIIIPERLRKRHWDGYRHVIASGESRYGEGDILAVPGMKQDGTRVTIEFTIVPLRDGAGALTGLAAIMRDVTERFEEMRALKQKLAEAMKTSP
jgi:PAS domain S-box-containing protein